MATIVKVNCKFCNKEIDRPISEFNRSSKLGRPFYCNHRCNRLDHPMSEEHKRKNSERIKQFSGNGGKRDELSPFREVLRKCSRRNKEVTLTLNEIKEVWEKQLGKCPYTGWTLSLPPSTGKRGKATPRTASLERIDSIKGYVKDNIEFVALIANYAKNTFTKDEVLDFCKTIKQNSGALIENNDAPFKRHLSLARRRAKNRDHEFTITIEDLKNQWNKQEGRCLFSGWLLDNPKDGDWDREDVVFHSKRASLDRIDSTKGYTPSNIQFVSLMANLAKNDFSNDDLTEFRNAVRLYHGLE